MGEPIRVPIVLIFGANKTAGGLMQRFVCNSLGLVAAGVLFVSGGAFAQAYPNKPIRMIIPYGAGGSTDTLLRIVATRLPGVLGQSVVIDNRTGASGMIGSDIVAKAQNDGYTLLGTGTPHVIVPNLYKHVKYDVMKDFTPIMQVANQPYGLTVHPSLGVSSVKELIALAKREPGKHNYASSGQGGAMHLFQALFVSMANINIVHIPYKGSGAVRADLVGGQVKIGCIGLSSILPLHRSGNVRIIAVTTAKRSPALPDMPTIGESVPGYDASLWSGILAPQGTPAAAIKRIHSDITKVLRMPEVQDAYQKLGTDIVASEPKEFGEFLVGDFSKWRKVVQDLKLKIR
jgi:tripartite-type tricarboxylate transporter receptor subunit TctC